jgi:hypothetical protein
MSFSPKSTLNIPETVANFPIPDTAPRVGNSFVAFPAGRRVQTYYDEEMREMP